MTLVTKYLNPQNDVAFKKIFGTEKNKDILIHFINDMTIFKRKATIVDVVFLKTLQDPETLLHKTSIVDVLCKDQEGHQYIVEMQVGLEKTFAKRAQYYAAKTYSNQLLKKGKYHHLKEVVFLAIANFVMFPEKKHYKSDHIILDNVTHENDLKDFSFSFVELPKFKKKINELDSIIDKWIYFLKHAQHTTEKEMKQMIANDPIIEKAFHALDRYYWSEIELRTYDQSEKYIYSYEAAMEQKFDEGKLEGKLETAREMKEQNIPFELIVSCTRLSKQQIDKA